MTDLKEIGKLLQLFMQPLAEFMQMPLVTEICINQPETVWVEQDNIFRSYSVPALNRQHLTNLIQLIAEFNNKEISQEMPLLSAMLPNGARVQAIIPPACEVSQWVMSIRRQAISNLSLTDYVNRGAFKRVATGESSQRSQSDETLLHYYETKQVDLFLKEAVRARKNIIISGGTQMGKSTLLNAMLKEIALTERIITIETEREVMLAHPNVVHLLACDGSVSLANIAMLDLLKATLRLRPDRILVSELRAEEAFPYLRAINSGHPGSITTLHADTPAGCFDQLVFMVLQGGTSLTRQDILRYTQKVIDIVVQLKKDKEGQRYISEIYYKDAPLNQTSPRSRESVA